jgi:hypothetical protein
VGFGSDEEALGNVNIGWSREFWGVMYSTSQTPMRGQYIERLIASWLMMKRQSNAKENCGKETARQEIDELYRGECDSLKISSSADY